MAGAALSVKNSAGTPAGMVWLPRSTENMPALTGTSTWISCQTAFCAAIVG